MKSLDSTYYPFSQAFIPYSDKNQPWAFWLLISVKRQISQLQQVFLLIYFPSNINTLSNFDLKKQQ